MTTFRKRYSLNFWPHPLGRGCVCGQNIYYHIVASVVSFNLICNMTTFRKRYSLAWPFDPTPWVEGVSVSKIFAIMLLPASSALIWYATWPYSEKKFNFDPCPTPLVHPTGSDTGLQTEIPFDMFLIYCCSVCMQYFSKNIINCLSYCENLTFHP